MSQPESRLSRRIAGECRGRGMFIFKIHGGPTMMSGLPDLVGSYRGLFVSFETKMPESKDATPVQRLRHEQIKAAGGVAVVVRSVADAMAVLDAIDASINNSGHETAPPPKRQRGKRSSVDRE